MGLSMVQEDKDLDPTLSRLCQALPTYALPGIDDTIETTMAATYPPLSHQMYWAEDERQSGLHWTQHGSLLMSPPAYSLSRSPSITPLPPMQRFLQDTHHPLFMPGAFDKEPAMQPYPDVPLRSLEYINYAGNPALLHGHSSPSHSGLCTSHSGSSLSDRDLSPWSSPHVEPATYPHEAFYTEQGLHSPAGFDSYLDHRSLHTAHGVTLHDVQQYADTQPEAIPYDDEPATYGSQAHEGYHPMQDDTHDTLPYVPSQLHNGTSADNVTSGDAAPVIRRRRATSTRSVTSPRSATKITKRPSPGRRSSSNRTISNNGTCESPKTITPARGFPCPFATYGCSSTFGSKNEWKRHVHTQHMRLGFWRCDQCGESKPNDFNRKDLFIQHVRRMHPVAPDDKKTAGKVKGTRAHAGKDCAEDEALANTQKRCYRKLRLPPAKSECLLCDQVFVGPNTWEERMEHIGRHMEAAKKDEDTHVDAATWRKDVATEEWLLEHSLLVRTRNGLRLA
ncbi:hypothetical protein LTR53_002626 [Teratosphaeriaceae sp. CCFEE 6253]|nr:hypothetical protein LTR53_002626 [Teratosphaeriaceae sp. CCFEE 6253]